MNGEIIIVNLIKIWIVTSLPCVAQDIPGSCRRWTAELWLALWSLQDKITQIQNSTIFTSHETWTNLQTVFCFSYSIWYMQGFYYQIFRTIIYSITKFIFAVSSDISINSTLSDSLQIFLMYMYMYTCYKQGFKYLWFTELLTNTPLTLPTKFDIFHLLNSWNISTLWTYWW